jgi:hypothetical protein
MRVSCQRNFSQSTRLLRVGVVKINLVSFPFQKERGWFSVQQCRNCSENFVYFAFKFINLSYKWYYRITRIVDRKLKQNWTHIKLSDNIRQHNWWKKVEFSKVFFVSSWCFSVDANVNKINWYTVNFILVHWKNCPSFEVSGGMNLTENYDVNAPN